MSVLWNRVSRRPYTLVGRVRIDVRSGGLMSGERTIAGKASLRRQRRTIVAPDQKTGQREPVAATQLANPGAPVRLARTRAEGQAAPDLRVGSAARAERSAVPLASREVGKPTDHRARGAGGDAIQQLRHQRAPYPQLAELHGQHGAFQHLGVDVAAAAASHTDPEQVQFQRVGSGATHRDDVRRRTQRPQARDRTRSIGADHVEVEHEDVGLHLRQRRTKRFDIIRPAPRGKPLQSAFPTVKRIG